MPLLTLLPSTRRPLNPRHSSPSLPSSSSSFTSTRLSPVKIPEILELILSFLPQPSLRFTACLVSRQWYTIAQPLILRHLYWRPEWDEDWIAHILTQLPKGHLLTISSPDVAPGRWFKPRGDWLKKLNPVVLDRNWNQLVQTTARIHRRQQEESRRDLRSVSRSGSGSGLGSGSGGLVTRHPSRRRQLRGLCLEGHMNLSIRILPFVVNLGQGLDTLCLKDVTAGAIPLGLIFEACPRLEHLSVVADVDAFYDLRGLTGKLVIGSDEESDSKLRLPTHLRIKTLVLQNVESRMGLLEELIKTCPRLVELRLLRIYRLVGNDHPPVPEFVQQPQHQQVLPLLQQPILNPPAIHPTAVVDDPWTDFYDFVADHCPDLRSFHYTTPEPTQEILSLMPRLQALGTMGRTMTRRDFRTLRHHSNTLTSLTLQGRVPTECFDEISERLHDFLCQSPLLEHVYAEGYGLYIDRLDVHDNLNSIGKYRRDKYDLPPKATAYLAQRKPIWVCQRLKTLEVEFKHRNADCSSVENARLIFGYISRCCPALERLKIRRNLFNVVLESGLCLLTRLKKLKRLVLVTEFLQRIERKDVDWIVKRMDGKHVGAAAASFSFKKQDSHLKHVKSSNSISSLFSSIALSTPSTSSSSTSTSSSSSSALLTHSWKQYWIQREMIQREKSFERMAPKPLTISEQAEKKRDQDRMETKTRLATRARIERKVRRQRAMALIQDEDEAFESDGDYDDGTDHEEDDVGKEPQRNKTPETMQQEIDRRVRYCLERDARRKAEQEADENMYEGGVDMTHLGRMYDIVEWMKDRRAQGRDWVCWPDMEVFEMHYERMRYKDPGLMPGLIKKYRPDIQFIFCRTDYPA